MKKWTIALVALVCGGYFGPATSQGQQREAAIECRDTCSTFASALRELSAASQKVTGSRSFEAFITSCRRLCTRGVFSGPVLEGITDSLSSLSSEEVRALIVVPPKPLPVPNQETARSSSAQKRGPAKALALTTPLATVTSTVTAISTYYSPKPYFPLK